MHDTQQIATAVLPSGEGPDERPTQRRSRAGTVLAVLDEQARRFPDDPFLITASADESDDVISFGTMRAQALDAAAGLLHRGLAVGDRVAFMAANRPQLVTLTFGAAAAGMITVPINLFLKGEFLRHQLVNSAARAIAVDGVGLAALAPLLNDLPDLRLVILLDEGLDVDGFRGTVIPYAALPRPRRPMVPHQPGPLEAFLILYTSGTTGPSKGCMLGHAYMIRVADVMGRQLLLGDDDIQICVHPLFHMSGQMDLVLALTSGTPIGLERQFSASGFFPRAKSLGATYWGGPGITEPLLAQPPTREHELRRWIGTPLSPESETRLRDEFGIASVCQLYAQTEANPVSIAGLDRPAPRHTDGWIVDDIDCQIVDDDDRPVPVGQVGQIVLRPRVPGAMFSGYWNDAEGTVEAWRNLWHHTGDLGRIDEQGLLTFVDRKSDAMRRKGENISAMELERALLAFSPIAEVATHGVRLDGQAEEDIKACIVLAPGAEFDRAAFASFLLETLPRFAMIRYYEILAALPRNPIGRVQKFELRRTPITEGTVDLFALGLTTDRRR